MKRIVALTVLLVALTTVWAQGPNESGIYYLDANGKKGAALKTALSEIIVNPRNVGYDGLWEAYKKTDTRADGYVRDWYSNATNYCHITDKAGSYQKEGDCYNREHTVPQSWFGDGDIKSDVVHVVPTDGYVNNRRSNYPFGEVKNATYTSKNDYCKLGSCKTDGYSGTVFEPNDEIKGDIARIFFYMITRYEGSCGSWGHDVFTSTYPGLTSWTLNMMMRWSRQDPVDAIEIARNNAVYEVQGNRNPYVDYPGLEEYTWGTKMDQTFCYDNYEGGSPVEPDYVYSPTFSPDAGSYENSVTVTLSSNTSGASIYYTTDGSDATTSSTLYESPFTLTETTTVKAIAVKNNQISILSTATYTITSSGQGGEENPVSGTINLNNALFGTSYDGAINNVSDPLSGTVNGVTVTYDKAGGNNLYCNNEQIRLYPNNTLTIRVEEGNITAIEFVSPEPKSGLKASVGDMNGDLEWNGNTKSVVFSFDGSKHIKLSGINVTVSGVTGISPLTTQPSTLISIYYTLDGRRVQGIPTRKGVYIVNGKKILIK